MMSDLQLKPGHVEHDKTHLYLNLSFSWLPLATLWQEKGGHHLFTARWSSESRFPRWPG